MKSGWGTNGRVADIVTLLSATVTSIGVGLVGLKGGRSEVQEGREVGDSQGRSIRSASRRGEWWGGVRGWGLGPRWWLVRVRWGRRRRGREQRRERPW
jgi:hypothetical protein